MIPERFSAWLTVNRACNLRCGWCYAKSTDFQSQEDMSLVLVKELIGFLRGLPIKKIVIIGGEPTIHPDFLDIVASIKEAGFDPLLITNGIKFKDKAFLKESRKAGLISLATSLKGGDRKSYLSATSKDAFSDVMEAIHNINELGIMHKISLTLCAEMFSSFEGILKTISRSGVKLFSVDTERPIILDNNTQSVSVISPKEMAKFLVDVYPRIAEVDVRCSCLGISFF